jgi:hypothetical protein
MCTRIAEPIVSFRFFSFRYVPVVEFEWMARTNTLAGNTIAAA